MVLLALTWALSCPTINSSTTLWDSNFHTRFHGYFGTLASRYRMTTEGGNLVFGRGQHQVPYTLRFREHYQSVGSDPYSLESTVLTKDQLPPPLSGILLTISGVTSFQ